MIKVNLFSIPVHTLEIIQVNLGRHQINLFLEQAGLKGLGLVDKIKLILSACAMLTSNAGFVGCLHPMYTAHSCIPCILATCLTPDYNLNKE